MAPGFIYRNMMQAELDAQYNARATVEDITPYLAQYRELSEKAHRALVVEADIQYGLSEDEKLDLFPAGEDAPLLIFIHGGYWRLLSKEDSAFMAETFVGMGIAVASINYSLAPKVNLDEIVRQVRACIAYLSIHADRFGIDRTKIFLCGTSAGGQLSAMATDNKWISDAGLANHPVAGACLISGLYDLEPVRHCHPNEWLNLDKDAARRNSPAFHVSSISPCPSIVTWAGADTDEFKRQSLDYARQLIDAQFDVDVFEVSDRNHFDIALDLADAQRPLTRKLLEMIAGK